MCCGHASIAPLKEWIRDLHALPSMVFQLPTYSPHVAYLGLDGSATWPAAGTAGTTDASSCGGAATAGATAGTAAGTAAGVGSGAGGAGVAAAPVFSGGGTHPGGGVMLAGGGAVDGKTLTPQTSRDGCWLHGVRASAPSMLFQLPKYSPHVWPFAIFAVWLSRSSVSYSVSFNFTL
eukprot:3356005-Prymnesium_polylepis.1